MTIRVFWDDHEIFSDDPCLSLSKWQAFKDGKEIERFFEVTEQGEDKPEVYDYIFLNLDQSHRNYGWENYNAFPIRIVDNTNPYAELTEVLTKLCKSGAKITCTVERTEIVEL